MPATINTTNRSLVGVQGDKIVFIRPIPAALSKSDALNLAAYIVALCPEENFQELLEAVQNT